MAQPTPYERQFAFSGQPRAAWAEGMENELNAVKVTSDETLANLELIQRDDGALRNGVVTRDSLAPDVALAGLVSLDFADEATSIAGEVDNEAMTPLGTKKSVVANSKDGVLTDLAPWISGFPTVIQNARERVSLAQDRAVDRTGSVSVTATVISALRYLSGRGGGKLIVPWGAFLAGAAIQAGALGDSEIEIEFEAGGFIKAAVGLSSPVLDLRASSSVRTKARYIITNPNIDCSAGDSPLSGGDFCTALAFQYATDWEVNNPFLYGGEDPHNLHADAAITSVACGSGRVNGGRVRGFNDGAVYPNADNDGASTDVVRIYGTHISRCMNAAAVKRDLALFVMDGCVVEECVAGVVGSEIPPPGYVAPPRRIEVVNTDFIRITANAALLRGPTKGRISGCTVQDFGYTNFNGTGSVGANAIAFRLEGASEILVDNNEIKLKDWALAQQIGAYVDNVTLNGGPFTGGKHRFANNVYRGIATGINEAASVNASTYLGEVFDGVANPVGGFFGASGSLITMSDIGAKRQFVRNGNSVVPVTRGLMATSTSNVALTAPDSGGTYRNDGATGLVTYTLPTAAEGREFSFIVSDDDGIRIQTSAAGQFVYLGASASSSGGYAQSTTPISTLTLRAINSTIWVATAQTGTWAAA